MESKDRIDLKRLMEQQGGDYEDNTDGIRRLKHSQLILDDVYKMEHLKKSMAEKRKTRHKVFEDACKRECSFLYNKYTDIFNRLIKDELDLDLLSDMLLTMMKIEEGQINQQEGSVIIGKILHKIYVESALKRSENIDKSEEVTNLPKKEAQDISWKKYKTTVLDKKDDYVLL